MPARRIPGNGGSIRGSFPSLKNDGAVLYESTIERDLLFYLEFDQRVLRYTGQPFTIEGSTPDGSMHSYTPDYHVVRTDGESIIECKPAAKQEHPHTKQQVALGTSWAEAHGHDFVVVTDVELRTGPRLANLKLLWRYARFAAPFAHVTHAQEIRVDESTRMSFNALVADLAAQGHAQVATASVYHLLFRHVVVADLDLPLTPTSLVWLPSYS